MNMRNLFKASMDSIKALWGKIQKENDEVKVEVETVNTNPGNIQNKLVYNSSSNLLTVINSAGDSFVLENIEPTEVFFYKTLDTPGIIQCISKKKLAATLSKMDLELQENELEYDNPVVQSMIDNTLHVFSNNNLFEVIGEELYFKGIYSLAIPRELVVIFIYYENLLRNTEERSMCEQIENVYNSYILFTLKLMCNPVKACRESLLQFVQRYDVRITHLGNIVLYRRAIELKDRDAKIDEFVRSAWTKIKTQKRNPKNYSVYYELGANSVYKCIESFKVSSNVFQSKNYVLINNITDGESLDTLYQGLTNPDERWFTSSHDKNVRFKIGGIYRIAENKIELNPKICHSGGLAK